MQLRQRRNVKGLSVSTALTRVSQHAQIRIGVAVKSLSIGILVAIGRRARLLETCALLLALLAVRITSVLFPNRIENSFERKTHNNS